MTRSPLSDLLARRIRAAGPLSVADYMAEALLHPLHGYYATRDPLGAQGDFITAPEISQIFGELIGLWCVALWQRMGGPDPILLAELGPGRGTLMADALRAARLVPAFGRALRLHLVEASPVLRRVQATRLADADPTWHDTVTTMPDGPLLLIANEFLDALPIRQFVRTEDGWHERRIGLAGDDLAFLLDPMMAPQGLPDAPPGSLIELCPAARALTDHLARRLAQQGGAALFIDYGHTGGCGETLQAVQQHRPHGVLDAPGTADLTAHVNFAALATAAEAAGARAWGPVTQGGFLASLGIAQRAERLMHGAPAEAAAIASAVHRLIDPAEMGTLFKVMAVTDRASPAPAGFPTSEERG